MYQPNGASIGVFLFAFVALCGSIIAAGRIQYTFESAKKLEPAGAKL